MASAVFEGSRVVPRLRIGLGAERGRRSEREGHGVSAHFHSLVEQQAMTDIPHPYHDIEQERRETIGLHGAA